MKLLYDDGGRAAAGFRGHTGDCVVRACAIATRMPYREVYDELYQLALADRYLMRKWERRYAERAKAQASPRTGVARRTYHAWLLAHGYSWQPTMKIGQGCRVHVRAEELPTGLLVLRLSRHLTVVEDGRLRDTHDPSRGGTRCVYGYYERSEAA